VQPLQTVRGLGPRLRALQQGGDAGGESPQLLLPGLPAGAAGVGTRSRVLRCGPVHGPSAEAQARRGAPHLPGEAALGPGSPHPQLSPRPGTSDRAPARPAAVRSAPLPAPQPSRYLACLRKLSAAAVNMPAAPPLLSGAVRGQSGPRGGRAGRGGSGGTRPLLQEGSGWRERSGGTGAGLVLALRKARRGEGVMAKSSLMAGQ